MPKPPDPPKGLSPRPSPLGDPRRGQPSARSRYQHLLLDGRRFFEAKDYDTAFSIYRQAINEAPPGDTQALSELCRCYRKRARKAFQTEDFPKVICLLTEMLALPQVQAKALDYKVLGECHLELGQLPLARTALEQAVALKPELVADTRRLFTRLKTEELSQEMNGLHGKPKASQ